MEKNFQIQNISEGSELIKNEEHRLSGHCEHSELTIPDRPGRVDSFHGLTANFYSLKTKKIPAGRLALVDWLGLYSVGSQEAC